ncbi:MAG: response regulator [Bacteroidales bacterium]|jgi:two-component system cell cycle response regulator DivK|nr:response regulator [Bacteroidales bacterium]
MRKVLVIEDNEKNMYLITYILNSLNCEVRQAITGELGLEFAIKEKFDLILMDIQLPGMNGYETTKKIRNSEKNAQTQIIAVTSFAMLGDKKKALDAGCTGYIEKPINPETLIIDLKKYLNIK